MNNYKTASQIREICGITTQTLYNWRKENKIKFKQLNSRKILYDVDSLELYNSQMTPRMNIVYARVSQVKQKPDLDKQKEILSEFANKNGYTVGKVYDEIASGMNETRVKFNEIIDLVLENKVNKIFITYKDRLTRFGFTYFENLFKKFNTEIIVLNDDKVCTLEQELTEDLVSIIHYFSMRMYSNRRKLLTQVKRNLEKEVKANTTEYK